MARVDNGKILNSRFFRVLTTDVHGIVILSSLQSAMTSSRRYRIKCRGFFYYYCISLLSSTKLTVVVVWELGERILITRTYILFGSRRKREPPTTKTFNRESIDSLPMVFATHLESVRRRIRSTSNIGTSLLLSVPRLKPTVTPRRAFGNFRFFCH